MTTEALSGNPLGVLSHTVCSRPMDLFLGPTSLFLLRHEKVAVGKRHSYAEINIELTIKTNNKINALFFNTVECSVCEHILMQFMLLLSFLLPGEFIAGFYCRICPVASSSWVSVASFSFEDLEREMLYPLRHREGV